MGLSRFYLEPARWGEGEGCLTGDEAHHCARVLRHAVGDAVEVFDGRGRVAEGRVRTLGREAVEVAWTQVQVHEPLPWRVHLMPALIKGEAFEWLLEKAVELGAASVRPVLTANTVVRWEGEQAEKKLGKWRRQMLEAAKQCHTPFLPELRAPVPLEVALEETAGVTETLRLVPALTGRTRPLAVALARWGQPLREARVLTGPEGDFTEAEVARAVAAGFEAVSLGPLVLRAETASLSVLAVLGMGGAAVAGPESGG